MNIDEPVLESKLPPHSTDAEQAVLAGILQQPDLMNEAVGLLEPSHFYRSAHQEIYRALLEVFNQQVPLEPIAITNALQTFGTLDIAGGSSYLWDLCLSANENVQVINPESLHYWAKIIIDKARRRELIAACYEIQEAAHNSTCSDYMGQAENLLFILSEAYPSVRKADQNFTGDALSALETELTTPNGITGLSTGFPNLDKATHGFQPHQLITVSARPGGGKSAFALNVASHVVLKEQKTVLYISLEMTGAELMKRVIKAMAGTDYDLSKLKKAAQDFKTHQHRFIVEDAAGQTLSAIQSRILKAKQKHADLGLIVVDHIGLIAPESNTKQQNRAYEIQQITSRLKVLAKNVQVPILQLAQMNRAIEGRQDKKPMLSDLRDSGSIEMDSDIVIFTNIERDEERRPTGNASLTIAKQRDGVQMEIPLLFIPHLTQFKESFKAFCL
jgi:replicative DNA helicase